MTTCETCKHFEKKIIGCNGDFSGFLNAFDGICNNYSLLHLISIDYNECILHEKKKEKESCYNCGRYIGTLNNKLVCQSPTCGIISSISKDISEIDCVSWVSNKEVSFKLVESNK